MVDPELHTNKHEGEMDHLPWQVAVGLVVSIFVLYLYVFPLLKAVIGRP